MKKCFIEVLGDNADGCLTRIRLSEHPDLSDGWYVYAVFESPAIYKVSSVINKSVGWHDDMDRFVKNDSTVLVHALNALRQDESLEFVCRKLIGCGKKGSPVVELSQHIVPAVAVS